MATVYQIHPDTPQIRRIESIRDALKNGAIMLYPTDTVYAIGCDLTVKPAVERVRQLKQLANDKPLTFLCSSLSNIAQYAWVTDSAYRIIKRLIPGPYTFLLPATKLVPRLVMNPKRKTTGIRVPNHPICQSLMTALGNPVVSTSALTAFSPDDCRLSKPELFDRLDKLVDLIIDDECGGLTYHVSTVIDFTGDNPVVVRPGLGYEAALNWVPQTV
jgi:tRNA threonylcarbamoyl adenosine modification protein (Sua5/YciO/YrdC/YwlC family)